MSIGKARTVYQEVFGTKLSGVAELLSEITSTSADEDKVIGQVGRGSRERAARIGSSGNIGTRGVDWAFSGNGER
jgi:hypothetical protein